MSGPLLHHNPVMPVVFWFLGPNKTHWKLSQTFINWETYRLKEGPVLMTEHCLNWRSNTHQVQRYLWRCACRLSLQLFPGFWVRRYCWHFNSRNWQLSVLYSVWLPCKCVHMHRVRIRHEECSISPCHLTPVLCPVSTVAQPDLYLHLVYTLWLESIQEVFSMLKTNVRYS